MIILIGRRSRWLAFLAALWPSLAQAGGFFLPGHGVRGLGRGGAFVAGGDDAGAIWYNPAAIAGLRGVHVLVDGTLVLQSATYTRVDSGGNLLPSVRNEGPLLPIPTLAFAMRAFHKRLWIGASLSAPTAALPAFPRPSYDACPAGAQPVGCLDTAHTDAPQRYSLISYKGTLFVQLDLAVAFQLLPQLAIGISLQNQVVGLYTLKAATSYNGALSSGPEDPEFDTLTQTRMLGFVNPSAKVGLKYQPHPRVKLGLAVQLPVWVRAAGAVDVQLPASPLYSRSSVEGTDGHITATFPLMVGAGVEVRPIPRLRLELDLHWESWSMTERLSFVPDDIYISNVPGIGRYKVPEMAEVLHLRDALSVRLGVEYFIPRAPVAVRAGYVFERGAVEDAYASVLLLDHNKQLFTAGASLTLRGFRLDALYGFVLVPSREVDHRDSRALQINPISPAGAVGVGGGHYETASHLLGLGVSKAF
ncbi:MAG: outer membrane protein transport protein [Deltaproteobacteria bacterium]|nr:outer membrane protein transport protein [Deltaproteobacteria bacterium]